MDGERRSGSLEPSCCRLRPRAVPSPRSPGPSLLAVPVVLVLLGGCASQQPDDVDMVAESAGAGAVQAPQGPDQRFRGVGVVLESPQHGPQLCTTVAEPLPPTCQGVDVVGWDWDAVEAQSVDGTTWGGYVVVGTWSAETSSLTLTEPAVVDDGTAQAALHAEVDLSTRCPEPAGGWQPVDAATATQTALDSATELAEAQDGFSTLWLDQRGQPAEEYPDEPLALVLNVTTTADPATTERGLREVWGGALCVSAATGHSDAELEEIQAEVMAGLPDFVSSSIEAPAGPVVVEVLVATAQEQRDLDARFGKGVVRLTGTLTPVS